MSDVDFLAIAQNIEDPGTYIEVDPSRAALGSFDREIRGLIIAQRLSTGTVAEATPTLVRNGAQADTYFGIGSVAATMVHRFKRVNPRVELWVCALDDDGAGTEASVTQTLGGTATEDGSLQVLVDDEILVPVAVTSGDDGDALGAAIVSAVTASKYDRRNVTPSYSTPTLTWTHRHKGTVGNGHRIEFVEGTLPAGLTVNNRIVYLASGATDPDMDTATAALGDTRYTHIASGLNDTANIGKLCDTFLGGPASMVGRWAPGVKKWGLAFFGINETQANSTTAGNAENASSGLMVGAGKAQKPEPNFAAEMAAIAANLYAVDPARDPYGQRFGGTYVAPAVADQFTADERDTLNTDGIATVRYRNGSAHVQRAATLYQTNAGGTPDKSCHDLVDMQNLMASLEEIEQIADRYVGWKLAPDGTQVPFGAKVMTPSAMAGLILSWYKQRVPTRFVDYDGFAEELLSQINSIDQNRLDQIVPVRLIPHLYVNAIQVQFIKGVPFQPST